MSAISPPPVGADAEETVMIDNRNALASLQKKGSFPKIAVGGAVALGLIGVALATLGATRRPAWRRAIGI